MKKLIISSQTGTRSTATDYLRKAKDLVDKIHELALSEGSDEIEVIANDVNWYLDECLWYLKQ